MALALIIPVKPFAEAKQRLGSIMSDSERAKLAQSMFRHVFSTALRCVDARAVIVVTRAPDIVDFAERHGAVGLVENTRPDLNEALAQAAEFAREASRLLVLASDLPLLREDDLACMIGQDCAIAPDRRGHGTNAIAWPVAPAPRFSFGENSLQRHLAAAKAVGLDPKIISRPGLAHDVDLPDDLLPKPLS